MSNDAQGGLTFADALSLVLVLVIIQIILRLVPDVPESRVLEDAVHLVVQQPRAGGELGVDHLSFIEVDRTYALFFDQSVFGNPNLMAKNAFLNAQTCQAENWPAQKNSYRTFAPLNEAEAFEAKIATEYGLSIRTIRRGGYPPLIEIRAARATKPVTIRVGFGLCTAGTRHKIEIVQHTFTRGATSCTKHLFRFDQALFKGSAPDPASISLRSLRYIMETPVAVEVGTKAPAICHRQIAQNHNVIAVEIAFDGVTTPAVSDVNGGAPWAANTSCTLT